MEQTLLKNYSDREKGAYLGAIASIATADHSATEEELEFVSALAEAAELNEEQSAVVTRAATEISDDELRECLNVLKTSELRYSLITDLIAFAKSDGNYSNEERAEIARIAKELNINQEQYQVLDEFVDKSAEMQPIAEDQDVETQTQGFMKQQGLSDKFNKAGINMSSITSGLLAIAGPMLLSRMLGGRRRGGMMGGGMLGGGMMGGGLLGGLLGGGGGLLGGGMMGGMGGRGGMGSLISMLSGGRGYRRSGGLLGRLFS